MSDNSENQPPQERYFSFADLWRLVWGYRGSIAAAVVLASVISAAIAFTVRPSFRAEATASQVSSEASGLGLKGQLSGLASIAGISLGGRSNESAERLAILRSRFLLEEFIVREGLMTVLFDKTDNQRTVWFGVKKFRDDVVSIKEDTRSGLITVSVEWYDAALAALWANKLVALANDTIRQRDAKNARNNIDFLNQQLQKTTVIELQRDLYTLIEGETKTLMMANTRADYAFVIVDPAVPPELKTKPARSMITLLGGFFGFVIGVCAAAFRRIRRVGDASVVA